MLLGKTEIQDSLYNMEAENSNTLVTHALFERIANNDPLAFKVFYNYFYSKLYRYCTFFTNDQDVIKELISDVFVSVWQNRRKITEIKNIENYLFIAVRNQSYKYLKENNQYQVISIEDIEAGMFVDSMNPERQIMKEELRQEIELAINSLPQRCKLIFSLIRHEKKSTKEVAELLNISEKTVYAQMCIAVKKLGMLIKDHL